MAKEEEKATAADKGKGKAVDGNDTGKDVSKDKDLNGKKEEEKLDLPPGTHNPFQQSKAKQS